MFEFIKRIYQIELIHLLGERIYVGDIYIDDNKVVEVLRCINKDTEVKEEKNKIGRKLVLRRILKGFSSYLEPPTYYCEIDVVPMEGKTRINIRRRASLATKIFYLFFFNVLILSAVTIVLFAIFNKLNVNNSYWMVLTGIAVIIIGGKLVIQIQTLFSSVLEKDPKKYIDQTFKNNGTLIEWKLSGKGVTH